MLNKVKTNKMELLQSQAPVDQELSGPSASARYRTLDIRHGTQKFENTEEKLFLERTKKSKIGIF